MSWKWSTLAGLLLVLSPSSVLGQSKPEHKAGHRHKELPNLVGGKFGYLNLIEQTGQNGWKYIPAIMGGAFYERVVLHNWLEIELVIPVGASFGSDARLFVPMDIHFKKPFHIWKDVALYVGLGPTLDVVLKPEKHAYWGLTSSWGAYWWLRRELGVDFEIDYNVVRESGHWVQQIALLVGPVYRFRL